MTKKGETWEEEFDTRFSSSGDIVYYTDAYLILAKDAKGFIRSLLLKNGARDYKEGQQDEAIRHTKEHMNAYKEGLKKTKDIVETLHLGIMDGSGYQNALMEVIEAIKKELEEK